jgi:hypothetical protein
MQSFRVEFLEAFFFEAVSIYTCGFGGKCAAPFRGLYVFVLSLILQCFHFAGAGLY